MHPSDKLGFGIIIGGICLIGITYLLFRVFGDSSLISLIFLCGWLVIVGLIAKFFGQGKEKP